MPVLLLASDPYHYAGSWTADACQKVVRFVDIAETFHLPVVYLEDCPGFLIGLEAEKTATIRHGVRAMAAMNQTSVPVVHHHRAQRLWRCRRRAPASRPAVAALRVAVRAWGSLPLEGGIEAAYRAEIDGGGRSGRPSWTRSRRG